ncbi:hypothetical protein DIPPA_23061 [Diplonema papillatum]|nr:hypothetical protein DIPPA_23061 [Diplonema papillatum]
MGGGKKEGAKKKAKPGAPCGNANAKKQPAAAAAAAAGEPAAAANGVGHKPPGPDAPPAPCGRKTPSHDVSFTAYFRATNTRESQPGLSTFDFSIDATVKTKQQTEPVSVIRRTNRVG